MPKSTMFAAAFAVALLAVALPARADDATDCLVNAQVLIKTDPDRVAAACRRQADQGDAYAQSTLGLMYEQGTSVPQDYAEAARWFHKAADHGDAFAQGALGWMYENGKGVPQDYAEAMQMYRKGADQGFDYAEYSVGSMFDRGEGVARDASEAARWYRNAADHAYGRAQTSLGLMYATGQGVPQDYVSADMWFNLATAAGNADADKNRTDVETLMTPEQIAEAKRRASEWKPSKP